MGAAAVVVAWGSPRAAHARAVGAVDDIEHPEPEAAVSVPELDVRAGAEEPEEESEEEQEARGRRGDVRARAEEVQFDARDKTLDLIGNVRVDSPPFHLRSQRLRVTRTRYGIEVDGPGSLAFCPCLGTPLKVDFERAIVAPPGDLVLERPTLRVYGVPVLPLPYFWLRSAERFGLLPPDIAYRARDGLYAGLGIHVPFRDRGERHALDLRGGAYLAGGFVADARFRTPRTVTKVRIDRLAGDRSGADVDRVGGSARDGVLVDARGSIEQESLGAAWDVDAIRGRRGLVATTDLGAAARPWDRASFESSARGRGIVVSTGVRAVSRRGGGVVDLEAVGPVASARTSGAIGGGITYDATVEGGTLRLADAAGGVFGPGALEVSPPPGAGALSFARADVGVRGVVLVGPAEASLDLRGVLDAARTAERAGDDRAGQARARVALPLAKRLGGRDDDPDVARDPWIHVLEPFVEAAALHTRGAGMLGVLAGRGGAAIASGAPGYRDAQALAGARPASPASAVLSATAPIAFGGVLTSFGRAGARRAVEIGVSAGVAPGVDGEPTRPVGRARAAVDTYAVGASVDAAHVGRGGASSSRASLAGAVAIARARLGAIDGPRLVANVAARRGVDPVLARALASAPLEPDSGFLSREGTTGGAGVVVPWSRVVTTSLGADVDADARELVGARGAIEIRDRCGCVTLRVLGAHRVGREGVDVWLALDFADAR